MTDQFEMFSDVVSIDKGEGTRVCKYCEKEKGLKDFALGIFRADGSQRHRNICKICDNERKKLARDIRKTHTRPDDYCCPICLAEDREVRSRIRDADGTYRHPNSQTWVIDHDRKTMTFRAWLCDHCNKGLGMFHEDVHNLRRAVNYLDKHDNNS